MLFLDADGNATRVAAIRVLAAGLIFGGILDTFHAAMSFGVAFVWLRTLSTCGGGLIMGALLASRGTATWKHLPWAAAALALAAGAASVVVPGSLPAMVRGSDFTATAKLMNLAGALGYLAGAARLLTGEKLTGRFPILIIGNLALFGTAGLLFGFSSTWEADWWWWHLVRYAGSLFLFLQCALHARDLQRRITAERNTLEEHVRRRTAELENTLQDFALNRYMLDKATIAVYLIDEGGVIVYANEWAANYSGYTREELMGSGVALIDPATTAERWAVRWAKVHALAPGELDVVTMTHRRKDGSTYPIEIFAHHLTHGSRCYQLSIGVDISGRLRAEKEKARFAAMSDQALELARAGTWSARLDDSGGYTSSERLAAIFGDPVNPEYRYTIAHWHSCIAAVDPALAAATADRLSKARAGLLPRFEAVYPYKRPADGRVVWVHALGVIIHDPDHPHPEMHGVVQDITEVVQTRHELETAKRGAETANRLKSDFLANMSHEIRTPMNAILGYAQLLARDPALPRDTLAKIGTINRAGEHLLALINDVLEMSKIEAGKSTYNESAFDPEALVSGIAELYAERASAKSISFELVRATPLPPTVLSDEGKVRQALLNLVGNAVKFTKTGGVVITAGALRGEDGLHTLSFAVRDTGPGLTPEERERLFKPFVQSASGHRAGGTGLGLAISLRYARMLGGDIAASPRQAKARRSRSPSAPARPVARPIPPSRRLRASRASPPARRPPRCSSWTTNR
jgi:PAS domain S-box-containing protein